MGFESTEIVSLTFQLFYCAGHSQFSQITIFFNQILCLLNSLDHASEVQVTMMLTESCKLRGLHHR